jgi:arylsulfatase A-like enzyme
VAAYEGAIERLDAAIDTLIDGLEDAGVREETLVVVTTEHGPPYPRAKCSGYAAGSESALVMDGPGVVDGVVREELVNNVDFLPTLGEYLDVDVPENVEGRSYAPLLTGDAEGDRGESHYEPRERVFGEQTYHCYYNPIRWVQTEDYRLIVNFTSAPVIGGNFPVHQMYRFATKPEYPDDPANSYHETVELYYTAEVPVQSTNLAGDDGHADIERKLLDAMDEWMRATDDPLLEAEDGPLRMAPIDHRAMDALRG